ncbi:MAG: DUF6265 family protein [Saprospiraceae bacterium]
MNRIRSYTIGFVIPIFFCTSSFCQSNVNLLKKDAIKVELVGSPIGGLDDISWITGHWKGEAFGGEVEEIWSSASGKSMMGMFKLISEGETKFYELMTIREVNKTLIMQLKHFHHNMKGWEEKDVTVDFPLIKIEQNKVWFDGLTFEKISKDKMVVNVILDEDKPEGIDFIYHLQP